MALRSYSGEADKRRMASLVHAATPDNLHVLDLPYRLSSWALDHPENIGFWEDETGRLLAWAVLQTPFWTLDYAFLPTMDRFTLYSHILSWADSRARAVLDTPNGRPMWFVEVRAGCEEAIHALEEAGFACQSHVEENPWSKVFLERSAQIPAPYCPLPEGSTLRPLAGENEIDAYVELHRAVFGSNSMTAEWRRRVLQCPEYLPDLDLVAVTAEGRLAGFCVCLFAATGMEGRPGGQIEPMGVHPDFQRQGLGRALLSEGLRRLHGYGAEQVCVETDNDRGAALGLYESVGFRVTQDILIYRKDYNTAL